MMKKTIPKRHKGFWGASLGLFGPSLLSHFGSPQDSETVKATKIHKYNSPTVRKTTVWEKCGVSNARFLRF
jgi:hypothetical protein